MIVDKIDAYLSSGKRALDPKVLMEAQARFRIVTIRQLMEERTSTFHLSPSNVGKCPRQLSYFAHGFERPTLQPRALRTFWTGDILEIAVLMLAKLAGCDIDCNNVKVETDVGNGYIDGLLHEGGHYWDAEFKSMSDASFMRFKNGTGLDDTWGYASQVQCYMRALEVDRAVIVAYNKNTGHMHEKVLWRKDDEFLPIIERAKKACETEPEDVPRIVTLEDLKYYSRLKLYELPAVCSYCDCKLACWPGVKMAETKKVAWRFPAEEKQDEKDA